MEKIIEIDLKNKYDLIDRYNEKKVSTRLVEYIIKQGTLLNKNNEIKIIINKKSNINKNCIELIKNGLKEEYNISLKKRNENNVKQLFFLIVGIIFIFLSMQIKHELVWKEILLITGWVPIWKMIEVELFPDTYGRRKRRIIRKLLDSEIIERNIGI